MRPRSVNDPLGIVHPMYDGTCALLMDDGCKIKEESLRPMSCRLLIPNPKRMNSNEEEYCSYPNDENAIDVKRRCVKAWIPFQDEIVDLLNQEDEGACYLGIKKSMKNLELIFLFVRYAK